VTSLNFEKLTLENKMGQTGRTLDRYITLTAWPA